MQKIFLHIYDWAARHRAIGTAVVVAVVALCALSTSRLHFDEDITAFLPVDEQYKEAMQIYQEVASADKVVLQLKGDKPEVLIEAAQRYGELLEVADTAGWIADYAPQVDYVQVEEVVDFIYSHLPYLLEASDYARLDSLWDESYEQQRFMYIREQLGSMAGSFLMPALQNDPLNLGGEVAKRLRVFQPQMNYVQIDGYIFSSDSTTCLVTMQSPFGNSETDGNSRLIDCLNGVGKQLQSEAAFAQVSAHLMGAPVVAVGNASQIKHDTIVAVSVSLLLILLLLLWAFRSLKALVNIVLATGFGFLFGLSGVALFDANISLIVIGISSVIMGIAVNYPLHMSCEGGGREGLRLLVRPLLIGNITTVGAFLTLTPLKAVALRDLGLFSALMLVGTILWVLLVQPHMGGAGKTLSPGARILALPEVGRQRHKGFLTLVICLLTILLGYFSIYTSFDSEISHLNYMTDEQRTDMAQLQQMQGASDGIELYLTGSANHLEEMSPVLEKLEATGQISGLRNPVWFVPSPQKQQEHLALWQSFWRSHDYLSFLSRGNLYGYSDEAFEPFRLLVEESHEVLPYEAFAPLTQSILTGYVGHNNFVARMSVADAETAEMVESVLPGSFDIASLNRRVVNTLTDDFNYIGFACGLIVFLFLWISFGRIELAFVAFLPMAIGWIWILGIMQLLGIQFNIVNVILATFIFGQGDDYTIFITESIIRRYKEGSSDNRSEMQSILLSAAIMLLGIGVLILAKHPAMHSLAEVTIVGMAVVVLMAWLIPPIVFDWLVKHDASLRKFLEKK